MSSDGEVTLDERIWMHKLCENNLSAKALAESLLSPYKIEDAS